MKSWEIRLAYIVYFFDNDRPCFVGPVIEDMDIDHLFYLRYITGDISKLVSNHVFYTDLVPTQLGLEYCRALNIDLSLLGFFSYDLGIKIDQDIDLIDDGDQSAYGD
jgi:hypothetical protein